MPGIARMVTKRPLMKLLVGLGRARMAPLPGLHLPAGPLAGTLILARCQHAQVESRGR